LKPRFSPSPLVIVVIGVVYFVAGKLGLMLAVVNPSATAVWPPTGIALAAFLVLGYRVWPAILLGAFFVNVTTAGSIATSIGIAIGNTLEGAVGAYLVNRFANGRRVLDRAQDIFKFALLAALVSTTVSPTIGLTSLSLGGFASWADYKSIWITWWLGDASGDLVVAPVFLLWSLKPRLTRTWNRGKALEAAFLLFALILVGVAVFGGPLPLASRNYPLEFMCVPILLWAAFRFRQREAATAIFLLSGIAIWGTLRGFGPFHREAANESLLLLQAFMGVIAVTTMALAAVVSERRRVEETLSLLESAVHNAAEGVVILAVDSGGSAPSIIFVNEGFSQMTGFPSAEVLGETLEILRIAEADRDSIQAMNGALAAGERFHGEVHARRRDGSEYALELALTPVPPGGRSPSHWVAILRDVSARMAHLETLERQALYDFLTGLPNRILLHDRLEQAILAAEREGVPLALCLMDLDRFKEINDTLGHQTGDALLKQLGPRLRRALRTVDTVARLGGDEFAILLPTVADKAGAAFSVEKILKALEKPFVIEGQKLTISASVGIALCPQHGTDWTTLMRNADSAMYAAKKSRKGYALSRSSDDSRHESLPSPARKRLNKA
jgi:diguanylate cyclase (GGDEF)-like protein/PAS domain S-box-containing protein